MVKNNYSSGYIERKTGGYYEGALNIEGIDISPIEGSYFKQDGKLWLWLKRKPLLEYDIDTGQYFKRSSEPHWEAYMSKSHDGVIAYRGEFIFLRFKYQITGFWDDVLGIDRSRLNLYIERLPMNQQTIIKAINKRNKKNYGN